MTLYDLAVQHGTNKAEHGYCPLYERHLGYLTHEEFTLVEIGVATGGSLRMWRDYFTRARIVGIDRNPNTMIEDEPRIETVCDNAAIPRPWRHSGLRPTVIVDDGSHSAEEVTGAWQWTWPLLQPGGWYVIEDLATQFCVQFGGHDEDGSVATDLLADLLDLALRSHGVTEFHAYQQIVFVRKDL